MKKEIIFISVCIMALLLQSCSASSARSNTEAMSNCNSNAYTAESPPDKTDSAASVSASNSNAISSCTTNSCTDISSSDTISKQQVSSSNQQYSRKDLPSASSSQNRDLPNTSHDGSASLASQAVSSSTETQTTPENGYTQSQPIQVLNISLNITSVTIYMDETLYLTANIMPDNAADKTITWTSSDTSVAEVSQSGVVTPKVITPDDESKHKTAVITATGGNGISASCTVTVFNPYVYKKYAEEYAEQCGLRYISTLQSHSSAIAIRKTLENDFMLEYIEGRIDMHVFEGQKSYKVEMERMSDGYALTIYR